MHNSHAPIPRECPFFLPAIPLLHTRMLMSYTTAVYVRVLYQSRDVVVQDNSSISLHIEYVRPFSFVGPSPSSTSTLCATASPAPPSQHPAPTRTRSTSTSASSCWRWVLPYVWVLMSKKMLKILGPTTTFREATPYPRPGPGTCSPSHRPLFQH